MATTLVPKEISPLINLPRLSIAPGTFPAGAVAVVTNLSDQNFIWYVWVDPNPRGQIPNRLVWVAASNLNNQVVSAVDEDNFAMEVFVVQGNVNFTLTPILDQGDEAETTTPKRRDFEKLRKYIAELPLAVPRIAGNTPVADQTPGGTAAPGAPSAAVDAGSLVSFVGNVPQDMQPDVLNSTLFAQLAANAAHSRFTDFEDWYEDYVNILNQVGWDIQGFNLTQFNSAATDFQISTVVLDVLAAVVGDEEVDLVGRVLENLDTDTDALSLWNNESASGSQGNFQVSVVSFVNNVLAMALGAFYFFGSETVSNVLFFTFSSESTTFFKDAEVVNLDEQVYSQVRDLIIDRLGAAAQTLVQNIPLAPS